VKDIINGICYQRYEKRLEQQKSRPNDEENFFALQKKIWKRTAIKSVFEYRFNSNKHTHVFLFVTQAFWVFIVRIWILLVCNPFFLNH